MDFGIAGVAAITVICYLAGQLVKASGLDNKWIPIICGVVGGILGVLAICKCSCITICISSSKHICKAIIGISNGLS